MTEAEAWREIARRIVEGEWSRKGLRREALNLYHPTPIVDFETAQAMHVRIYKHVSAGGVYEWGTEPEARALAALWLALEAEEEAA